MLFKLHTNKEALKKIYKNLQWQLIETDDTDTNTIDYMQKIARLAELREMIES